MAKKRILALGVLVAVISVTGIIVYNSNRNEADTVETVAHIETDEATTPTPPTPVEEDKKVEDNTSVDNTTPVKEDNESIETEDTTPVEDITPTEDTTEIEEDTETKEDTVTEEDTVDSDITPLDQTMYAQGNVNTRSGPSTDYEKIGGLSVNEEVHVIGQSKSTGWYEIEVSGSEKQFVSNQFLSTTKIQSTQSTTTTTSTQSTQSQTTNPNQTTNAKAQAILDALGATSHSDEGWNTPSPIAGDYSGLEGIHGE